MDVPDLPLVLKLLESHDERGADAFAPSPLIDRYCYERAIAPDYLYSYLASIDRYLAGALQEHDELQFVGFSVWTSNYLTTLIAAAHLKRRARPPFIVAGGPQVTESGSSALLCLRSGLFDAVIPGEGGEALLRLYESVDPSDRTIRGAPKGVIYLDASTGEGVLRRPAVDPPPHLAGSCI